MLLSLTSGIHRAKRRRKVTSMGLVINEPKGVPLRRGNLKTLPKLPDLQR